MGRSRKSKDHFTSALTAAPGKSKEFLWVSGNAGNAMPSSQEKPTKYKYENLINFQIILRPKEVFTIKWYYTNVLSAIKKLKIQL